MRKPLQRIALGLLFAGVTLARPQSPGTVEGMIVRVGSGEPIAGINVEMRRLEGTPSSPTGPPVFGAGYYSPGASVMPNSPNPSDIFYARTNEAGRFAFANLKPGKYRLLAAHPQGLYYPAEYGQRNPRGPGYDFTFEDAQSMRLRLEMAPMASVTGRVIGADGKPAAHVHVMATEIAYENGVRVLNQVQAMQTDDRGNYRLFWLPPGRYYIGAFSDGLRQNAATVAFAPPGAADSLNQIFQKALLHYSVDGRGELVEETYETVYAPGDINPDTARVVDLRLGTDVTGIDISLVAGRRRTVRVRGLVIDGATGQPARNANVRVTPLSMGPVTIAPAATTDANGAFEIQGVTPGNHFIIATLNGNGSRPTAIQSLVTEAASLDGLKLVLTPGATLSGRMTMDAQPTDEYRVGLGRNLSFFSAPTSGPTVGGQYSLTGVRPGDYRVNVIPVSPNADKATYIKSIRYGGVETSDGEIHVGDGPVQDLEIALGRNGGTVAGQVVDAQKSPAANTMVVIVPEASRRGDLFKTATTDGVGRFRIAGLAPGNYSVFSWPWLPNGIWRYPDFLRAISGRGNRVTVAEGLNADLTLTLLPEVTF